jgi:hypothetical protein
MNNKLKNQKISKFVRKAKKFALIVSKNNPQLNFSAFVVCSRLLSCS